MATISRLRGPRPAALALLAVTLCVAGCHDAAEDPMAVVLTEETHPALSVAQGLPALPDLIARTRLEGRVTEAIDLWLGSWERDTEEARALRDEAYAQAAAPLARALEPGEVERVVAQVGDAVAAVSALEPAALPPSIALDFRRVRALDEDARAALAEGDEATALARALESADALREVGPRAVASVLVVRAQAALDRRRGQDGGTTLEADLERADRLLKGARLALVEEDWSRAVRRAYYACQLLGVDPR